MSYLKIKIAVNALVEQFFIRFVLIFIMLIACNRFVNCSDNWSPEKEASEYLNHFRVEVSKTNLREGDRYNVSCWTDNISYLNKTFCRGLDQLSININERKLITKKLNETGIYHEVESAEPKHLNDYKYTCRCNGSNIKSAKFMIGVKWTISDFKCRFIDVPGSVPLNCGFGIPSKVFDVYQDTIFDLQYNNKSMNCSKSVLKDSSMLCTFQNFQDYKFDGPYNFKLSVSDSLTDLQVWNFTLSSAEVIVLEKQGANVKELNKSVSSICLEWDNLQKDNYNEKYKIIWDVQLTQGDTNKKAEHEREDRNRLNDTLCLLNLTYPHYNYTVSVKQRINDTRAHWSEPFIYNFTTNPTIPSRPPNVWPGSYHFQSSTDLRVYWQQIELLEQNGPQFSYNVTVLNVQGNKVENAVIQVEENMAIISNLQATERYKIIIKSQNSEGMSINSSYLETLPEEETRKRVPKNLTIDQVTGELSWDKPKKYYELIGYTIYWCKANETDRSRCRNSTRLEADQVFGNRSYQIAARDDSYNRAVSALYQGNISGGMMWERTIPFNLQSNNGIDTWEGVLALFVLGLCVVAYFLFRRYQYMSDIKVDLPTGILIYKNENVNLLSDRSQPNVIPNVLSASIKPMELTPTISDVEEPTIVVAEVCTALHPSPVSSILNMSSAPYVAIDHQTNVNSTDYIKMQTFAVNPISYVMAPSTNR